MKTKQNAIRTGRNIGAILGGVAFLAIGLVPAFYFASMGSVALMASVVGPLEPTVLVRMLIVAATAAGLLLVGTFFIVAGALIGVALAHVSEAFSPASEKKEAKSSSSAS